MCYTPYIRLRKDLDRTRQEDPVDRFHVCKVENVKNFYHRLTHQPIIVGDPERGFVTSYDGTEKEARLWARCFSINQPFAFRVINADHRLSGIATYIDGKEV
jgi:hypothetical protein